MYKIIAFTPVWGRHEVLKIMLKGLARLMAYNPAKYKIIPFFIVSNPEDEAIIKATGYDYILYKNNPLGEKKNAGLKHIYKNFDFDYILEIGSDDLIANHWLDQAEPLMHIATPFITLNECWFYNIATSETAQWQADIIGAARFISRKAITSTLSVNFTFTQSLAGPDVSYQTKSVHYIQHRSAVQYRNMGYGDFSAETNPVLWNDKGDRGMDTYSTNVLARVGILPTTITPSAPAVTDIKSETNLNPFSAFPPALTPKHFFTHFPELAPNSHAKPAKNPQRKHPASSI